MSDFQASESEATLGALITIEMKPRCLKTETLIFPASPQTANNTPFSAKSQVMIHQNDEASDQELSVSVVSVFIILV